MALDISDDEDYSLSGDDDPIFKLPKDENSDRGFLPESIRLRPEDNVASSSRTNLRSSFIGMGFAPSLIDRAIEEKGEDSAELLLETLFSYSELKEPKSEFSYDELLDAESGDLASELHAREDFYTSASADALGRPSGLGTKNILEDDGYLPPKEEPDICSVVDGNKMNSLLKMNFSLDEVRFALNKLGKHASIHQLMDYIFAARMANKYGKDANNPLPVDEDIKEDQNNEDLFGIMEKTLRLLEMGFTENEISVAFERCGSEAPLPEIAESIVTGTFPVADKYFTTSMNSPSPLKRKFGDGFDTHNLDSFRVKTEGYSSSDASQPNTFDLLRKSKGKTPKEEPIDLSNSWKKPKMEFDEGSSNSAGRIGHEARNTTRVASSPRQIGRVGTVEKEWKLTTNHHRKPLPSLVSKPPYFFYGDVTDLSQSSWTKISQFLYSVQPEFVNTQSHSALNRSEGYVHNLPCEDRFSISPNSPMTIQDALPRNARKWWPEWDTRKQLSFINCETGGLTLMCDRLGRVLIESKGCPSTKQQSDLLDKCEAKSLVWVGNHRLAPLEPEHLELIMGYPSNHTRVAGSTPSERLRSLKHSFQTDTLGYHLSVLRRSFPGGLTLLSFFTGIGGAEVALHRLGIPLKGVVSVEPCETNRRVLKQWWANTGQSGKLIQIESIPSLSGNKLEDLMKQLGGFDVVICQNPSSAALREEVGPADVDFSTFAEFVRVLQRVRSNMDRS